MSIRREPAESPALRAQAEAAAWMALLHSPQRNAAIESGLKRWIAEDPAHTSAWELATDLWNEAAVVSRRRARRRIRDRSSALSAQRMPRPLFAIALTGLLAAGWALYGYVTRDVLSTALGEQKTVTLEDGSRVELNTDSRLLVKYDPLVRKVVLRSGEAYFNVAHESRPFVVVAGHRKVIAVGTSFTVRHDPEANEAVTVTLIEGRVAVAPIDATNALPAQAVPQVTVLTAGERLRLRLRTPGSIDVPSIEKATGWMRGQLIFDHTPLQEAAAEFNRYSSTRIMLASAATGQIPVAGIFRIGDSKSFARAVADSHDLRLVVRERELILEPAEAASQAHETARDP